MQIASRSQIRENKRQNWPRTVALRSKNDRLNAPGARGQAFMSRLDHEPGLGALRASYREPPRLPIKPSSPSPRARSQELWDIFC